MGIQTTINHQVNLVVEDCCSCGILFAMPASMLQRVKETGANFYCPNGHSMVFRKSDNQKLKEETARLQQELSAARELTRLAQESAKKANSKIAQMKKRTANGVCPCCTRSFTNLQRHMKSQHPDYVDA